jgi:tetratricopeptide (TPR) repeat protein
MASPQTASTAIDLDRRARLAMARGERGAATALAAELVRDHPDFTPGWLTASVANLEVGRIAAALDACRHGLALAPAQPALMVQRVRCLTAAGGRAEAVAAAIEAEDVVRGAASAEHELANAWTLLGEFERALNLMQAARVGLPDDPSLNYNLATVLRILGRFGEAEALLDKVIAATPGDYEAYGLRSQLRAQTIDSNHVTELEQLLINPPRAWAGEVQLRHALAKEYEDLNRHADSFTQLRLGADLRRRHLRYDVAADVATLAAIPRVFDRNWYESPAPGAAGDSPIFVFGLPRSGTTLVDRILSSHPAVRSLGELNDFPQAVIALGGPGGRVSRDELLTISARADPRVLGEAYLKRVADQAAGAVRFLDKLPMNYLYAGLIAKSLPGARLVLVDRDPMAVGYAMYKTLFNQGYPFSYDLDELGRYIAAYRQLIEHWRRLLGARLIEVKYENLVANPSGQTRRLIDRCGLAWDDACLAPQDNPAPSSTQSAVQVRRPIYRDAIDQWRRHEANLAPLARWVR